MYAMTGDYLHGKYDALAALWAQNRGRMRWFDYSLGVQPQEMHCFADAKRLSLLNDVW